MMISMIAVLLVLCACLTMSHAFHFLPTHKHAPTTSTTMSLHGWRKALRTASILVPLSVSLQGFVAPSQAAMAPAPWDNKVQYEVLQTSPNGAQAKVGEIVAIRFQAKYKDFVIDDTFVTSDPYYMRVGVGTVVKGLDDALPNMREGEKIHLTFGGDLAFGVKGKPSAPGKPRIPPNAEIDYVVQLVQVPGTGEDIIADDVEDFQSSTD